MQGGLVFLSRNVLVCTNVDAAIARNAIQVVGQFAACHWIAHADNRRGNAVDMQIVCAIIREIRIVVEEAMVEALSCPIEFL